MQFVCSVLVGVLSVGLPDPGTSDNEGKIVGTWLADNTTDKQFPEGVSLSMVFTKDGKFTMNIAAPNAKKDITGTYTLGAGDKITLDNLSEPISGKKKHDEKVVIDKGKLTMTDSDGKAAVFKSVK